MKPDAGFNRLKDSYLFAHLTYCILTATCLIGWLKATEMRLFDSYNLLWLASMIAILALLPAQHKILTQTFLKDYRHLHLYKILYTAVICAIYIPIITSVFAMAGLSILTIVPVILASIVCGTVYGIATTLVMSLVTMYVSMAGVGFTSAIFTEQILLLSLLATTAWFIGQSFEYIINLYQQLLTSDQYLKKTLNHLGIATLHVNSTGVIIHCNTCFNELTGVEITGSLNIQEIAVKHLPFLSPILDNLIENAKEAKPVFGQLSNNSGQLVPVQCIIYPVGSGLEENKGAIICINDISLSKRLEEERILTNYFIDFINAGIIMTDAAKNIIEINSQAEHLLGVPKKNILNKSLTGLLSELIESLPDQELKPNYEMKLGDASLLINCADLCDNGGRVIGSVCIINDISDRKDMERMMRRSATLSAIGELAAGTAHEIRNPLTSIRGFLQLMKEKKDQRIGDLDSYFQLVLSEVDRINAIMVEFLKLARPEKMETQRVNLNEIINSIWDLLHNEAVLQEVKISKFQDPELPPIKGNTDMIKQVIINLTNNAIQAAGPKGAVRINTFRYKNGVRLSVLDNGPGIDKTLQERIFDPYFTTRDEGTGLGLAITSKIIHDHNGTINVQSAPGQGAKFDVYFPPYTETPGS